VEIIAALIGAAAVIAAAWITILPALRRDGSATREAVAALTARVNDIRNEQREDASELREHVTDIRAWQAAHDAEHFLQSRPQRGDS
jgi:hypothetical protein